MLRSSEGVWNYRRLKKIKGFQSTKCKEIPEAEEAALKAVSVSLLLIIPLTNTC